MIAPANLPEIIASRYRPIRLIGIGGVGAVYEVEHTRTGEHLALKVLLAGVGSAPETIERFKREARASATIKSEHVVRVTDADVAPELGGAPFLVMELLVGTDLERAAAAARPAPATVVEWLRQVAQAIDKAHGMGIVHRDLKPENLFLASVEASVENRRTIVKVLDFGIAKMIEDGTGATGTGQLLGTPKYMAPEQATANAPITPATDRCALGLIAYRLLTGESYYQGGVMSVLGQLLHGPLQPPSERASHLGGAFDAWFLKACHRNPDERFASAVEQTEALAQALGLPVIEGNVTLPGTAVRSQPTAKPARRALLTARRGLLVVAVLAAASVGVIAASRVVKTTSSKIAAPICGLPNRGTTSACGPCMAQACCKEAQECSAIGGCVQVEACIRACGSGDTMCRFKCYAAGGPVAQLQQGLETCRATHCAKECLPAPWACLGRVEWPYPSLKPKTIAIKTTAVCASCGAGGGSAPLAGARVQVCSLADPKCDFPLAGSTSDDSGAVTLKVDTSLYPPPLAVYLEYQKPGYLDTLLHLNMPPLSGDSDVGPMVLLHPKVNVAGVAGMLGTTYDLSRGFVQGRPTDCNGQAATKKVALTWLDRDQISTTGYFARFDTATAINLPIGPTGITRIVARVPETNQLIATTSVVIRPGAFTAMSLAPTP